MTAPLTGVTVLDFTRNLAGPFCTMILGDLGARVIKVERPGIGDDTRAWRPPAWGKESALFTAINRNKESVALDIDSHRGQEIAVELAKGADVVVESNRAGSMERRGLGFADIRSVKPDIVYCSISGFGAHGPQRGRPGYDTIVQAASGVMSVNGDPGAPPVRVGASIVDQGTGMWAALGILAALRARDSTGDAQHVETSLLETGVAWMSYYAANFLADGTVASAQGSRHALMAPYEGFNLDGELLFLAALNDNLFRRLCRALGEETLADDERFVDNSKRLTNRDELHERILALLSGRTAIEWEEALLELGIPCSRIKSIDEVLRDEQVEALQLVRPWSHPDLEGVRMVDHPISYSGTRSFRQDSAPRLGEHTEAVLREWGISDGGREARGA